MGGEGVHEIGGRRTEDDDDDDGSPVEEEGGRVSPFGEDGGGEGVVSPLERSGDVTPARAVFGGGVGGEQGGSRSAQSAGGSGSGSPASAGVVEEGSVVRVVRAREVSGDERVWDAAREEKRRSVGMETLKSEARPGTRGTRHTRTASEERPGTRGSNGLFGGVRRSRSAPWLTRWD